MKPEKLLTARETTPKTQTSYSFAHRTDKETQFSSVIKRFGGGAFQVILLSVLPGNTTLCLYVIISRSFSLRLQVSISLMSEEPH